MRLTFAKDKLLDGQSKFHICDMSLVFILHENNILTKTTVHSDIWYKIKAPKLVHCARESSKYGNLNNSTNYSASIMFYAEYCGYSIKFIANPDIVGVWLQWIYHQV